MRTVETLTLFAVSVQIILAGPIIKDGPLKEGNEMSNPEISPLNQLRPNASWITSWYVPDGGYMNNSGYKISAPKDLIKEGTDGRLTQERLSTVEGLLMTKNIRLDWGEHTMKGAKGDWIVVDSKPSAFNMSSRYGLPDTNNFDIYQIIVIEAFDDMKSLISPAQDDYAQIWINGYKWHNNSEWTGAVMEVDFDVRVPLNKGANVLLYRCSESTGADYANLHFDDTTMKNVNIFPKVAKDKASFFSEVDPILSMKTSVKLKGKISTVWANIKSD
jgi:hypothetical protein